MRSLYDFNFSSLITTKIIRFVYALLVILLTLGAVVVFPWRSSAVARRAERDRTSPR